MRIASKRIKHGRCVELNVRAIAGFEIDKASHAGLKVLGLDHQQVARSDALGPLDDATVVLLRELQLNPGAGFAQ